METMLLETNVISFVLKKDSRAASYDHFIKGNILATSFMTIAELYQWSAIHKWGEIRIKKMETELKKYFVLPYSITSQIFVFCAKVFSNQIN